MADVTYIPDGNQANNMLPWMLAGQNNGGLFGGNGWGGGILGFFLGLLFGNGWGGFGNGFGGWGGGSGAGFLSNQLSNDSGRELLMNAITSQGEAGRAATQNLATALGQDFNLVNGAIQTLQASLSTLALQQAVSVPQIINSIQAGDASLQAKLCECCCENRLLTTQQGYESQIRTLEQTNALGGAISGSGQKTVDAIADLKTTMVKEFCDARERDMQEKIDGLLAANSTFRSQIDNANQTAAITSYVNGLVSPIAKEVDDIKCRMPQTVPVTWPNLTAVNTTPYVSGGYYQGGFNGFYGPGAGGFGGFTF